MEPTQTSPTVSASSEQPRRKGLGRITTVVIIVVAIVAIAIAAFVLMNPGGIETPANEATSSIVITERGVAPSAVTVRKGDSVTWLNQDAAAHKIALSTPNPPKEMEGFGTGDALANGESYSFIFEAAGTYTYEDPDNPNVVQGKVIVEEQ